MWEGDTQFDAGPSWNKLLPGEWPFLQFGRSRPYFLSPCRCLQTPLTRQSTQFTLREPEWEKTIIKHTSY